MSDRPDKLKVRREAKLTVARLRQKLLTKARQRVERYLDSKKERT